MIPEFVTRISDYAFAGGWYLNDIFIDKNISFISENAFYSCYGLTSINVIVGNREYKSIDGVLYSKDGKKLIRYPQGKTRNSFIIPNDVICIADNAFGFCKNLTNIIINKEVSSIGMKAFWFCDNLRTIYYMGTETDWAKISIAPFSNVIDRDIYYYSETEPALNVDGTAYKGNYWRYVDGAIVVWKYIKE